MAARTQEAYIGALVELGKYYHRSPADLRVEEVQAYLLHLIRDKKLAYASVNQASCAFRFLYRRVLGRPEAGFDIPMAKVPKRLPQILSREEVARLIDSARTLRGRTLLMTTYAVGATCRKSKSAMRWCTSNTVLAAIWAWSTSTSVMAVPNSCCWNTPVTTSCTCRYRSCT